MDAEYGLASSALAEVVKDWEAAAMDKAVRAVETGA
jgi:hypothetical protein